MARSNIPGVVFRRRVPLQALRTLPAAVLLLALALLAACGKSGSSSAALPQGLGLLQQSGRAMGDVPSAHVDLRFDGYSCCFISSAQCDISRDGKANGSFVLGGAEYPFRLLKGTFY